MEHYCPWCYKTYPCPDPEERRGCFGKREMMCSECSQNPPPIEAYRPEFTVLRTDEVQERLAEREEG